MLFQHHIQLLQLTVYVQQLSCCPVVVALYIHVPPEHALLLHLLFQLSNALQQAVLVRYQDPTVLLMAAVSPSAAVAIAAQDGLFQLLHEQSMLADQAVELCLLLLRAKPAGTVPVFVHPSADDVLVAEGGQHCVIDLLRCCLDQQHMHGDPV